MTRVASFMAAKNFVANRDSLCVLVEHSQCKVISAQAQGVELLDIYLDETALLHSEVAIQ